MPAGAGEEGEADQRNGEPAEGQGRTDRHAEGEEGRAGRGEREPEEVRERSEEAADGGKKEGLCKARY